MVVVEVTGGSVEVTVVVVTGRVWVLVTVEVCVTVREVVTVLVVVLMTVEVTVVVGGARVLVTVVVTVLVGGARVLVELLVDELESVFQRVVPAARGAALPPTTISSAARVLFWSFPWTPHAVP